MKATVQGSPNVLPKRPCEQVDLAGAPRPGLALGYVRAPNHPQLPILTKAGGFGPDDLFVALAAEATARETHA